MTRFARARGSKSSNERVPEQATSWSEMRRDLHRESVRKAAEEQIKRESQSELHTSYEKYLLEKSTIKTKTNEPLELASFDNEPRLHTHGIQMAEYSKKSGTEKILKKQNHLDVSKKRNVQCSSLENSLVQNSVLNVFKTQSDQSRLATKINEPLELASFDNESRLQTHAIQMAEYSKKSGTEKILKKQNHLDVSKKRNVQRSSQENSAVQNSVLDVFETQSEQSRLASTTREILPFEVPQPGFSEDLLTSRDSNLKIKIKSDTGKSNVPTANKRKLQHQPKTSREGDFGDTELQIGGNFKGYPVPVEDAETLTDAYNILRKEGLTHKQAMDRIKPERRRAEKRLARLKSMICFRCRKPGHRLSDCPMEDIDCAVCFKCGSTTHKYQECRKKGSFVNAKCFICGVVGHLSAQCPENSHGVYPEGGECKICGEKSHLVKDCPQNKNKKDQHPGTTDFDDYFDEKPSEAVEPKKKKIKKVQF